MRASGPLRGLCQVDVEVRCLKRPVHSGQKGGAIPDPVQILCRLIADLRVKDGQLLIRKLTRNPPHGARVLARISRVGG